MGFIAKDSGGGNFKRVPAGVYIGRCYSLIDLGTQESSGQFGTKLQYKVRIGWELFGEDDQGHPLTVEVDGKTLPMTIAKSYTLSLHEKSRCAKTWRHGAARTSPKKRRRRSTSPSWSARTAWSTSRPARRTARPTATSRA
jgi:hypothetical protein